MRPLLDAVSTFTTRYLVRLVSCARARVRLKAEGLARARKGQQAKAERDRRAADAHYSETGMMALMMELRGEGMTFQQIAD